MLRLALPVVVAELGWTAMATVDTLMVGRLSPEAIGAVSLGSGIFLGVTMFGMGLLLGLDTLIAQAFGAGKLEDCHRSLLHGIYAALALTIPLTAILLLVIRGLPGWGINPDVLELTIPYLRPVAWSLLPLLLYGASRRFLQRKFQYRGRWRGACCRCFFARGFAAIPSAEVPISTNEGFDYKHLYFIALHDFQVASF